MFDDQPNQGGTQPPKNLPIGDPEDIFESVDTPPAPASPVEPAKKEEKIAPAKTPSAPPSALDAGVLRAKAAGVSAPEVPRTQPPTQSKTVAPLPARPQQTVAGAPPPQPSQPKQPQEASYQIKTPSIGRGVMIVVIIAVVVAILGGGGWWIYTNFIQTPTIPEGPAITLPDAAEDSQQVDTQDEIPTPAGQGSVDSQVIDEEILFGEPVDTDADSIDDITEANIGTDPNNWDSDGDELGDGDEIMVWETDPLNPDTDNDGFLDGAEVRNGYSPTGPGKIFESPTSTPVPLSTSTI